MPNNELSRRSRGNCAPNPYSVSVTRLHEERRREEPSPFAVFLVAEQEGVVTTTGGMRVIPDYTLANCPALDILVVPGGWGTRKEITNQRLSSWLADRGQQVETLPRSAPAPCCLVRLGAWTDAVRPRTGVRLTGCASLFPR